MKMMSIVERCVLWNSQRYDQKYDHTLARNLLLEETAELFEAHANPVEQLDAVGDIVFVAIGVFWKLGFTVEQIDEMFNHEDMDLTTASMEELYEWSNGIEHWAFDVLDQNLEGAYPGLKLACYCTFIVAIGTLRGMNMQHRFFDIVHAICDSNATKAIKGKVDPTVKANVDKGKTFVPPTERLREIWDSQWQPVKETVN